MIRDDWTIEGVHELLASALREDVVVGAGGRAVMRWTGVDRVLLARDRLAVIIAQEIAQENDDLDAMAPGNFV